MPELMAYEIEVTWTKRVTMVAYSRADAEIEADAVQFDDTCEPQTSIEYTLQLTELDPENIDEFIVHPFVREGPDRSDAAQWLAWAQAVAEGREGQAARIADTDTAELPLDPTKGGGA